MGYKCPRGAEARAGIPAAGVCLYPYTPEGGSKHLALRLASAGPRCVPRSATHILKLAFLQGSQIEDAAQPQVGITSLASIGHHGLEGHLPGTRSIDQFKGQFRLGSEGEILWDMGS